MTDEYILIDTDGRIRFVYSDLLDSLFSDVERVTTRASHVEPHPNQPGWVADMSPSGGPFLGADGYHSSAATCQPFTRRDEALKAEREWLHQVQYV